jgi:hypothetical protein
MAISGGSVILRRTIASICPTVISPGTRNLVFGQCGIELREDDARSIINGYLPGYLVIISVDSSRRLLNGFDDLYEKLFMCLLYYKTSIIIF